MLGLITVYKVPNYGTKLQAYAMQVMLEKYDEVEIINFKGFSDYRVSAVMGKIKLKLSRMKKKKFEHKTIYENSATRIASVNQFDKSYYHFSSQLTGTHQIKRYMKGYRAVICGSDQLWAPSNIDADYFTLTIVPSGIRKISFAASFGISEIPSNYKRAYKKFLNKMDYIAVREASGKEIVETLTDKKATVTLDPTLMLSSQQWNALADNSTFSHSGYIFCYFLGNNKNHRLFARELAARENKKVITIPHCEQYNEADVGFADIEINNAQPQDFLNLIRGADYVCTDSFHGTVFSTIFHRKVAVFERFKKSAKHSTNSRIYSLLTMLGEPQILYSKPEDVDSFLAQTYDYKAIDARIEAERKESFAYLDKALSNLPEKGKLL